MGQEQDDCPQVLLGCSPQEMLAQRKLQALQRGKEKLLLVLGTYPELFFFPGEAKGEGYSKLPSLPLNGGRSGTSTLANGN